MKCSAKTLEDNRCKFDALPGEIYCLIHTKKYNYTFDREKNDLAREEIKAYDRRRNQWRKKHPEEYYREPLPKSFSELVCGAKTRSGTPCKKKDIWFNGRCNLHGGMSTGPITAEGKKRSSENGKQKGCRQ